MVTGYSSPFPSGRGITVCVLRAMRRFVPSMVTSRRDSGESGDTCSIVRFPPLPPLAEMYRTVASRDRTEPSVHWRALSSDSSNVTRNRALCRPNAPRRARITCWSTFDNSASMKRSTGTKVQKLSPPKDTVPSRRCATQGPTGRTRVALKSPGSLKLSSRRISSRKS